MTSRDEFATAVRRGRRAGRPRLVAHAVVAPRDAVIEVDHGVSVDGRRGAPSGRPIGGEAVDGRAAESAEPARVGFVVSKAVGGSVVRHRVQRKLRHVVRDRLTALPSGTLLVVRALPPAATATSAELAADVDAAFRRLGLSLVDAPGGRSAVVGTGASDAVQPVDNSPSPVDGSS